MNFLVFSNLSANHLFLDFPLSVLHDAVCKESSIRHENVRALRLNFLLSLLLILKVYDTNIALYIKTVDFVGIMCSSLDDWVGAINLNCSLCKFRVLPHYFNLLFSL